MRIGQLGNGASLALEPFPQFRALRQMFGENLDGDVPVEACIAGTIHFAHSARAERRLNFVRPESCARGEGHRSVIIIPFGKLDSRIEIAQLAKSDYAQNPCLGSFRPRRGAVSEIAMFRQSSNTHWLLLLAAGNADSSLRAYASL